MAKNGSKVKDLPSTITIDIQDTDNIGVDSNIRATMSGDWLIIVIDSTQDLGPSSTGKMNTVASTHGFKDFPGRLYGNMFLGKRIAH